MSDVLSWRGIPLDGSMAFPLPMRDFCAKFLSADCCLPSVGCASGMLNKVHWHLALADDERCFGLKLITGSFETWRASCVFELSQLVSESKHRNAGIEWNLIENAKNRFDVGQMVDWAALNYSPVVEIFIVQVLTILLWEKRISAGNYLNPFSVNAIFRNS